MNVTYIDANTNSNKPFTDAQIVAFLHTHLDQYGDDKESISRCLNFAMERNNGLGGFAVVASEGEEIIGAVIINKTGMGGYIPENILVYMRLRNLHVIICPNEQDITLHNGVLAFSCLRNYNNKT